MEVNTDAGRGKEGEQKMRGKGEMGEHPEMKELCIKTEERERREVMKKERN